MSVEQIRKLRSVATPPEAEALDVLLSGLEPSLQIALGEAIERNRAADKVLQGLVEASSAQRNQKLALPYRLMVPSLARRLVYRSAQGADPELRRATECEAGSLATL